MGSEEEGCERFVLFKLGDEKDQSFKTRAQILSGSV